MRRVIEWVAIALGLTLLSCCLMIPIAVWLVLDALFEIIGSLSMNLEEFGFRKVLESVAIAISTLSMISYGSYWTPTGLLLGVFWIVLVVQEFKMHQRMQRENRELRESTKNSFIGDSSCRYSARSYYIRCGVNPNGPCEGCRDYWEVE